MSAGFCVCLQTVGNTQDCNGSKLKPSFLCRWKFVCLVELKAHLSQSGTFGKTNSCVTLTAFWKQSKIFPVKPWKWKSLAELSMLKKPTIHSQKRHNPSQCHQSIESRDIFEVFSLKNCQSIYCTMYKWCLPSIQSLKCAWVVEAHLNLLNSYIFLWTSISYFDSSCHFEMKKKITKHWLNQVCIIFLVKKGERDKAASMMRQSSESGMN